MTIISLHIISYSCYGLLRASSDGEWQAWLATVLCRDQGTYGQTAGISCHNTWYKGKSLPLAS